MIKTLFLCAALLCYVLALRELSEGRHRGAYRLQATVFLVAGWVFTLLIWLA